MTTSGQATLSFRYDPHPAALAPSAVPYYRTALGAAYLADSRDVLRAIPDCSVNLVFTSPPYALHFKKEYGNKDKHEYVDWILPFAREIRRILEAAQLPTQQVDARPRSYLLYALKGALNGAAVSVADLDAAIINPENLIGHERDAWEQLHHWADEGEVRARDKNYSAFHLDWLRDLHSKLAQ